MDVHGVDIWAHNVYWSTCTKPGKHGGCLIRSRNCLPFENTWVHPLFFVLVESVFLIFFVFCAVLLCVFIFWVPCCDVRYDFRMKTMVSSSLPPVACRRAHVFYHVMLFVFVCVWWSQHILGCVFVLFLFCFCFLRLVYPMLPDSLDCPYLIVSSVFSNVYLVHQFRPCYYDFPLGFWKYSQTCPCGRFY